MATTDSELHRCGQAIRRVLERLAQLGWAAEEFVKAAVRLGRVTDAELQPLVDAPPGVTFGALLKRLCEDANADELLRLVRSKGVRFGPEARCSHC